MNHLQMELWLSLPDLSQSLLLLGVCRKEERFLFRLDDGRPDRLLSEREQDHSASVVSVFDPTQADRTQ